MQNVDRVAVDSEALCFLDRDFLVAAVPAERETHDDFAGPHAGHVVRTARVFIDADELHLEILGLEVRPLSGRELDGLVESGRAAAPKRL